MSKANRKLRRIVFAVGALFLAIFVFAGCRTTEEPGEAELNVGRADYMAGDYGSAFRNFRLAADQGSPRAKEVLNELGINY